MAIVCNGKLSDQNTVLSWEQICDSVDADYYMLAGDEVTFETPRMG